MVLLLFTNSIHVIEIEVLRTCLNPLCHTAVIIFKNLNPPNDVEKSDPTDTKTQIPHQLFSL